MSYMEEIYFHTERELDKKSLEQVLSNCLGADKFLWIEDFDKFILTNELDQTQTYISKKTSSKGFKFYYFIFSNYGENLSLRQRIELLKVLSKKENIQIISTDDEVNPWSKVLVEPTGQSSTIIIIDTDDDSLTIDRFYNFPFGDFSTKTKLTDKELHLLKQIIAIKYPNINIHHGFDGPGDFNRAKKSFELLSLFENHYTIVPNGKNEWLDKNEKSELFVSFMKSFQKYLNKELCIFPSNYSEVKNIEGGSDSEEYCLVLTKDKAEKIIYKQRRKSWII